MMDFDTWILNMGRLEIFRMLFLRRIGDWTPYEQEQKFSDQDQYEDNHYAMVAIEEAIELPDGDILIGYRNIIDFPDLEGYDKLPIEYRKLSEIQLSYFPEDNIDKNHGEQ